MWAFDWNRIAQLHSQMSNWLIWSHIKAYQNATNLPPKWVWIVEITSTREKLQVLDEIWTHDFSELVSLYVPI